MNTFDDVTGLVGVRAITYFAGEFYSPVYGHCDWKPGETKTAKCAIGCSIVPSDKHQGCGFHAHFDTYDSRRFVEQIRGTACCIVLIETFGRVVVHEKGLRAEKARIIGALDFDPRNSFFTYPMTIYKAGPPVPHIAARYFDIPLVREVEAQTLIDRQRARVLSAEQESR